MTEVQARMLVMQHGAQLVAKKNGVEWFKKADGSWLALSPLSGGQFQVQAVSKEACGCG